MPHTANGCALPRSAGRDDGRPPGALLPRRAEGSCAGGDRGWTVTTCMPRMMVRPSVRFSSFSVITSSSSSVWGCVRLRMRRNSSVSASTTFMCCAPVSQERAQSTTRGKEMEPAHLVKGQHLTLHGSGIKHGNLHPPVDLSARLEVSDRVRGVRQVFTYVSGLEKRGIASSQHREPRSTEDTLQSGGIGASRGRGRTIFPCLFVADMTGWRICARERLLAQLLFCSRRI